MVAGQRPNRQCTPHIDAYDEQVMSLILQEQLKGTAKPIIHGWPSVNKTKLVYDITARDSLILVSPILLLRTCLERSRITVRTDYDPVSCILCMTNTTGKLSQKKPWLSDLDLRLSSGLVLNIKQRTRHSFCLWREWTNPRSKVMCLYQWWPICSWNANTETNERIGNGLY